MTTTSSPCINWCDIDPANGYCFGCFRTLAEIADWSNLSDSEKLGVWETLKVRKSQAG
ncbi:DUF1289 domain-containing protein [Polynucleobacter brandtiae]|uniref:DUF1289 domain-containing protein n=1 Tax=Polynucleobacter brandtiae TaxID=1938816 RepID=A0A2M8VQJ5_9BURK|nr:hypothetical protein B0G85_1545 [Polynucleobacter brandtiae]